MHTRLVLLLLGLLSLPAAAQTGVFIGTVTDATTQRPLAGAGVTALRGTSVHTTTTDADGNFRIPQLPPGVYSLVYSAEGFTPYQRTDVTLRIDRTVRLNVQLLRVGAVESQFVPPAPTRVEMTRPVGASRHAIGGLAPLFGPRGWEPATRTDADCRIPSGADEVQRALLYVRPTTGQVVPPGTPGACVVDPRCADGMCCPPHEGVRATRRALCRSALLWQLAHADPGAFRVSVTR